MGAFGSVLGQIADALKIGGHLDCHHDLTQVTRHRLALGNRQDRLLLDLTLEDIDFLVILDDTVSQVRIAPRQCVNGIIQLLFDEASHLGQHGLQDGQILVIGLCNVLGHVSLPKGQPKRPVM